MPCGKKKRKPMVPLKTIDVIFRRRYVPNTQFYVTNRKHAITEERTEKTRVTPFGVPQSEKLLSYIKYSDRKEKLISRDRLSQPLHLKDNLKMAAARDISKRLFIEEPTDDVRAVVEIHPEFYTVIEGRPLRRSDDIKVYINNIRSYVMTRQQIGYRHDLLIKIDRNIKEESSKHDFIANQLKQHVKNFQIFLTEDYKKAQAKVSKAEKNFQEFVAINSEFLSYVTQSIVMNNKIFKLDAIRSVLKMYRSFLTFVAPLSWRQQNDESLRGKLQSIQFDKGEFVTDNDLVGTMTIEAIVESAKTELKHVLPAILYFETPDQMKYLFRTMELQSREYLTQLSKTDAPFRLLQERIKQLKLGTKQELDYFSFYIDNINNNIAREYYNETFLQEKFFRILNETFYDCVANPTTLKLKICIEYVYEQLLGKCEEGHVNLQDPMKVLENMYEDYNLRLDSLDFKIVKQAQSDLFAQDLKLMRNAYNAQRELHSFEVMTNALNKAFLPPVPYHKPVLKKFLSKAKQREIALAEKERARILAGERLKTKKYKISAEDQDGLLLFTEWIEGTDPTPYLQEYYSIIKNTFEFVPRDSNK